MLLVAVGIVLGRTPALAQSAADLSQRMIVDALVDDYTPVETVFRNADVCTLVAPPDSCAAEEEPADDSAWSLLQDTTQIHVTWDAERLYLAANATISGHALLLLLDYTSEGLSAMSNLHAWRRALLFGPALRPDALVAVRDAARTPELWRVTGREALERVALDDYAGVANFAGEAAGRALEVAIPWRVLFPNAPRAVSPDTLAPETPMFVLPLDSSIRGLRLAAVVVHAQEGLGAADVAPDGRESPSLDPRVPTLADRAARVDWDAQGEGALRFVDFGVAVQTQSAPRFVSDAPGAPTPGVRIEEVFTFRADEPQVATRSTLPDVGIEVGFSFRLASPAPDVAYLTATVFSMRGEHVIDLYRDEPRSCRALPAPYGCYGDVARDRWNGHDARGLPLPGGVYLLQLSAGPSPGVVVSRASRTIAVVN
ncbi:MAG: hypothetical protein JSW67_07115 [Candidatus Latescibacterota bacterium]|nr:MAG: hypothetical protein JSW67_07115 [Candidatus Latescibacterota bacterium]